MREGEALLLSVNGKLDTCRSVSLAHSSYMKNIAPCRNYGLRAVTLSGIGGISEPLRKAGLLHVRNADGECKKILCYAFDRAVGNSKEIILFRLKTIPLRFLGGSSQLPEKRKIFGDRLRATKSFLRCQEMNLRKAAITPIQLLEQIGALEKYNKGHCEEVRESHLLDLVEMSGRFLAATEGQSWTAPSRDYGMHTVDEYKMLMSEIQLRAIVQNMDKQGADQQTDGDEIMVKDGVTISKFPGKHWKLEARWAAKSWEKSARSLISTRGMTVPSAQRMELLRFSQNLRTNPTRMNCFLSTPMAPKDYQLSRQ